MNVDVEAEWAKVTEEMPKPVSEWWGSLIIKKYSESGREAHNLGYLQGKLAELNNFRPTLSNVNAFILALFFQYFHYDSRDSDFYSKNVDGFEKFATEAGLSDKDKLYEQVRQLLEASSVYSTEEHKTEGAFGEADIHYFLDLDMVCLGQEPEAYCQHSQDVAREYAFLDPASYRSLRQRVLRSFLLIPNIFATKLFREKYEAQARANIQQELNGLAT